MAPIKKRNLTVINVNTPKGTALKCFPIKSFEEVFPNVPEANLDKLRTKMKQKFDTVKWTKHPCGAGSVFETTELTRKMLTDIAKKYDIKTVSDAGAGDLSWIYSVNWDVKYTPYDIRKWDPRVTKFDITKEVLPAADLIICRHVLNHLGKELHEEALNRFEESGSKYIFVTHRGSNYNNRWGEILETQRQQLPNGKYWNFSLWRLPNVIL